MGSGLGVCFAGGRGLVRRAIGRLARVRASPASVPGSVSSLGIRHAFIGTRAHRASRPPGLSPAPSGSPFPLMYESGKETLSLSRSLVDSGNDLLSRAVSSQVPSARGGLTSVFGMGTGGSLQPLSPEIVIKFSSSPFAWVRGSRLRVLPRASRLFRPSTLPSSVRRPLGLANLASASRPAPSKPHRKSLTAHSGRIGSQAFPASVPSAPGTLAKTFPNILSDQALDRLVSSSSMRYRTSTDDLSTLSSSRGLTCFSQWQSSSSGGLHA